MMAHWSEETLAHAERWSDPGLVREGLLVFNELPQSAPACVLLATDLTSSCRAVWTRASWRIVVMPRRIHSVV